MNTLEWILWGAALTLTAGYVSWRYRSWRITLFLLLLVALPLWLSLNRMTQFLTIDEPYFAIEANFIVFQDNVHFWFEHGGKFRTSYMLYAVPMRFFGVFAPGWTETQDFRLLKAASWFISFVLLGVTHWMLERSFVDDPRSRPPFFLLFFVTYLLLPPIDLIMRAFTYDTLSLQLGVLAVVVIVIAFRRNSPQLGLLSVVMAFLAAQEKPIASPILFVIVPLYTYLAVAVNAKTVRGATSLVKGPLLYLGIALGTTLLLSLLEGIALTVVRNFRDGWSLLPGIIDPYTSWAQSVSTFTFGVEISTGGNILVLLVTVLIFYLSTLAVFGVVQLLNRLRLQPLLEPLLKWLAALILLAVIGLGLYGSLGVDGYLAGVRPIEPGLYVPNTSDPFMGGARYFGVDTFWMHTLLFVAYQYGLVLTDVPTVFWGLAGVTMLLSLFIRLERSAVSGAGSQPLALSFAVPSAAGNAALRLPLMFTALQPDPSALVESSVSPPSMWERNVSVVGRARADQAHARVGLYLALIGALLMPLAFGVFNIPYPIPYSSRYMSISVVLIVIMLALLAWQRIQVLRPPWQYGVALLYSALFLVELLPFAPMYGAFRPIWLNPSPEMQNGVAVQAWGGWGEEVMQVGQLIDSQCGQLSAAPSDPAWVSQPCDAIDFYGSFPGVWLNSPTDVVNTSLATDRWQYADETDYWVVSRSALIIGWSAIPTIEPEATLSYRGYPYAWVYQGSKLADSGYFGSDQER